MSGSLQGFPVELLGRYEPIRVLGQGGMGRVFLARDRDLGRAVAVKVVPAIFASEQVVRRLEREAQILARLSHPNVVAIYDAGRSEEGPYLVTEYLKGSSLDRPGARPDSTRLLLDVARGIGYIHAAGLLHRDVKPGNIMVTEEGRAVLVDFGLAMAPDLTRFTRDGAVVGTIVYLAPELFSGEGPGPAADWYSWGVTLYQLLEGRPPFLQEQVFAWATERVVPELRFRVLEPSDPRRRLIERICVPDPKARPGSVAELEEILEGREPPPSTSDAAVSAAHPSLRLASSSSLLRPASLSASGEPVRESRRGWPAAWMALVAFGLLCLLGLARSSGVPGLSWPGKSSHPIPPAEATPAGQRSPFPADHAARVRQELVEASGWSIDGRGRVHESSASVPDARELLDPDPAAWGRILASLPELARIRSWIREGGRVEELPEGVRGELAEVNRRYRDQLLPGPFEVYLEARPLEGVLSPPEEVVELQVRIRDLGQELSLPRLEGWAGTQALAYARVRRLRIAAVEELRGGSERGLPGGVSLGTVGNLVGFERFTPVRFLSASWSARLSRIALLEWLEEGSAAAQRWLYCMARSIRDEPATREEVALLFPLEIHRLRAFMHANWAFEDPAVLLGGEPRTPWGWLLHAAVISQLSEIRRRGGSTALLGQEEQRAWEQAAAGPGETSRDRDRIGEASTQLLRYFGRRQDIEAVVRTLRARREEVVGWSLRLRRGFLYSVLEVMDREQVSLGLRRDGLEALMQDSLGTSWKDDVAIRSRLGRIRKVLSP